jgi:hypothetical protein
MPAILRLVDQYMGRAHYQGAGWFWDEIRDVLDYGGGKFDRLTETLQGRGISSLVYDPFNRTEMHNLCVYQSLGINQADASFCSNTLNVIKEPAARREVLENIASWTKTGGYVFFTVYEGKGDSRGRKTPRGWQANRPTKSYMREVRRYFGNVARAGKLIIARNNRV